MNAYEKLIMTMRNESGRAGQNKIVVAEMTSGTSCKYGRIELDADDLLFAEHLLNKQLTDLKFTINSSGGESHVHSWKDESRYLEPLKKGDLVLLLRISDEKYVVLEKLKEVQ